MLEDFSFIGDLYSCPHPQHCKFTPLFSTACLFSLFFAFVTKMLLLLYCIDCSTNNELSLLMTHWLFEPPRTAIRRTLLELKWMQNPQTYTTSICQWNAIASCSLDLYLKCNKRAGCISMHQSDKIYSFIKMKCNQIPQFNCNINRTSDPFLIFLILSHLQMLPGP